MRSYGQYCGVARALDVVGDRWSLLIVRELLARPCRFTDLLDGLPGIARNLLSERLRALQAAELVARDDDRYVLTDRGCALRPVLGELVRWSVPYMVHGAGEDEARGHWVGLAAEALFEGADLAGLGGLEIGVDADAELLTLRVLETEGLRAHVGPATAPDVRLRGSMEGVLAALTGLPAPQPATVEGDVARLRMLRERLPNPG
ncbi:hypothetical protein DSM112329_04180 [Paraconexibacter sp. AEG42_29]|uniref:HTH hxlR-type domain-containing protein n=1 Tax=Paraconexibacter sp. AEG42_29 TaxID=2997339 RepID=A0AAU7B063_9ACTN